jgi:hypothetical protein
MAIRGDGSIFLTTSDDSAPGAYRVDRSTGAVSLVGNTGSLQSSGDCVLTKDDRLLMAAQASESSDTLVELDQVTAQTTELGPIGFVGVYGLSASFDSLFGLTELGEVIRIDPATGAGTLVFRDATAVFYGAANGD